MGAICSRCRRGSTSTNTSTSDFNPSYCNETMVQRPQSEFTLHNIDTLANDTNGRCNEEDKDLSENGNVTDSNSQRTSIENENASIDSVLSEKSKNSSPNTKRKSSFSDCSTNIDRSVCSTTSSTTTQDKSEVVTNTIELLTDTNYVKGISNEGFVISPDIKVKLSVTVTFL